MYTHVQKKADSLGFVRVRGESGTKRDFSELSCLQHKREQRLAASAIQLRLVQRAQVQQDGANAPQRHTQKSTNGLRASMPQRNGCVQRVLVVEGTQWGPDTKRDGLENEPQVKRMIATERQYEFPNLEALLRHMKAAHDAGELARALHPKIIAGFANIGITVNPKRSTTAIQILSPSDVRVMGNYEGTTATNSNSTPVELPVAVAKAALESLPTTVLRQIGIDLDHDVTITVYNVTGHSGAGPKMSWHDVVRNAWRSALEKLPNWKSTVHADTWLQEVTHVSDAQVPVGLSHAPCEGCEKTAHGDEARPEGQGLGAKMTVQVAIPLAVSADTVRQLIVQDLGFDRPLVAEEIRKSKDGKEHTIQIKGLPLWAPRALYPGAPVIT